MVWSWMFAKFPGRRDSQGGGRLQEVQLGKTWYRMGPPFDSVPAFSCLDCLWLNSKVYGCLW